MASKASAWVLLVVRLLVAVVAGLAPVAAAEEAAFDENYVVQWGEDGYHLVIRGTEANTTMDQSSGAYVCNVKRDLCVLAAIKSVSVSDDCACLQVPGSGPSPCTDQGSST